MEYLCSLLFSWTLMLLLSTWVNSQSFDASTYGLITPDMCNFKLICILSKYESDLTSKFMKGIEILSELDRNMTVSSLIKHSIATGRE